MKNQTNMLLQTSSMFIIQTKNHIQINACSCECMSYLIYPTISQHLWHQCMIILMHIYGIKARKEKKP